MNAADFDTQFDRLTSRFHLPKDATRETVAQDWYAAVQHYTLVELEHAVTKMIRTVPDNFWPPLSDLLLLCRGGQSNATSDKCGTCHGSTWINVAPFKSNGMIYEGACLRCPDCRVPPPIYSAPSHRVSLTAIEYREWSENKAPRDYMPDEQKAKPRPEGEISEMKAAMKRLRIKLFGPAMSDEGAA